MKKIAVMGSAFNPPTLGHLDVIQQALSQCDEVWLVPSFRHAWGKAMAPYQQRCEMVDAFVADLNHTKVKPMAIEHEIASEKPVYSYDLLRVLQEKASSDEQLYLLIGPDNAAAFDRFYKADEIKQRWPLLVVKERVNVRSTRIREALAKQKPIEKMTSPSVVRYLSEHAIYSDLSHD